MNVIARQRTEPLGAVVQESGPAARPAGHPHLRDYLVQQPDEAEYAPGQAPSMRVGPVRFPK
ncbi:hypothetical protein [Burkholderia pyrrocinia]|uniref:hypothetical protein n=1 Tax=Burkholderia pyrrocinia TaxID=60550 RepID=UPI002AB1004F|nr:hypothetical protein [Burkholderia pyrrocinia]